MRGARPRREGNFGDPHLPLPALPEGRGDLAPRILRLPRLPRVSPRCLRAAFPAEPGLHQAQLSHLLQPFPLWETPPNPRTPPPLRPSERGRGTGAAPRVRPRSPPGPWGPRAGTNPPAPAPRRDAGVCAVYLFISVPAHAPPGQPPPSGPGSGSAPHRVHPPSAPALSPGASPCSGSTQQPSAVFVQDRESP